MSIHPSFDTSTQLNGVNVSQPRVMRPWRPPTRSELRPFGTRTYYGSGTGDKQVCAQSWLWHLRRYLPAMRLCLCRACDTVCLCNMLVCCDDHARSLSSIARLWRPRYEHTAKPSGDDKPLFCAWYATAQNEGFFACSMLACLRWFTLLTGQLNRVTRQPAPSHRKKTKASKPVVAKTKQNPALQQSDGYFVLTTRYKPLTRPSQPNSTPSYSIFSFGTPADLCSWRWHGLAWRKGISPAQCFSAEMPISSVSRAGTDMVPFLRPRVRNVSPHVLMSLQPTVSVFSPVPHLVCFAYAQALLCDSHWR